MPVYDPERRCLIIRVVYDGPAFGGKTTNLRQLCSVFPVERRGEMYTPGSLRGRTMFFDWLELDAGRVGAQPLRCQLLTVPGQGERSYRRRPLLESADGVVFVVDSSPDALPVARKSFAQLRAQVRKRLPARVPLLVQANKQDTPGALGPAALARALRLDPAVPVLGASAGLGEGVRESVVAVIRATVREVQLRIAAEGFESIKGAPQTADQLFEALLELEDDPDAGRIEDEPDEPDPLE